MEELVEESPFDLVGSDVSPRLILVDEGHDIEPHISNQRMELTLRSDIAGCSRATKRKSHHSDFDDDFDYHSNLKYSRSMKESEDKDSSLTPVKQHIELLENGQYYITMMSRDSESDVLNECDRSEANRTELKEGQVYLPTEIKDQDNGILLLNKNDLTLCSVKQRDENEMKISVSLPIPVSLPLGDEVSINVSDAQQDATEHSYYRPGLSISSESPIIDPVRTVWVTSKADKNQLKQNGHTWKTGKWRKDEIKILKTNIEKYCVEHGIKDPQQIIFHATKDQRKNFYPTISAGLNRPLFAVYRRVKRMYDRQNYRGRYTEEEIKQLKELKKKHGKDWSLIGQQMGRSSDSVKDRCRLFKDTESAIGKWTTEEEVKLANAVYTVTGKKPGTFITEKIIWSSVAGMVGTRTEKQCRAKWLNYLNWKLCDGEEWTKSDDKLLVERIAAMNITAEEDIEWNKLSQGWKSARSPQWLRNKWWNLKRIFHAEKPSASSMPLEDLIKELLQIISYQIMTSWEPKVQQDHKPRDKQKPNSKSQSPTVKDHNKKPLRKKPTADEEPENTDKMREDWMNQYLRSIRPVVPKELGNQVYTVFPDNSEEGITVEKDCHGNFIIPYAQTVRLPAKLGSAVVPRHSKISDHVSSLENKGEKLKRDHIEHITEVRDSGEVESMFQLSSNGSNVYILQNPENSNSDCSVVLLCSEDINNVNFTITPEAFSLLSRASKDESVSHDDHGDGEEIAIDHRHHRDHDMMPSPGHHSSQGDVITTSDVLVYQEPNDDDVKNPVLSSAVHKVDVDGSHDDVEVECLLQSSSPLQGTLLEGTDLATATIRIDHAH